MLSKSLDPTRALLWVLITFGSGCSRTSEDPSHDDPGSGGVGGSTPLARMTSFQYNNTVRDLFAPAEIPPVVFPHQIEATGGFENNVAVNGVTASLVEAYQRAAVQVTDALRPQLTELSTCDVAQTSCARETLLDIAERAWRHPLSQDDRSDLSGAFDAWATRHDSEVALLLSIQSVLQAPDFVYFPTLSATTPADETDGRLDSWEIASRLSYFLWGSMPDRTLTELAREDALAERSAVVEQAWRMLADPRARQMVVDMHRQLLGFDAIGSSGLDLEHYSAAFEAVGFESGLDADYYYHFDYLPQLRFEPDVFVSQHVFEGDGTLAALLSTRRVWTTTEVGELAYGVDVSQNGESIRWQAPNPAGVLSDGFADAFVTFDYHPVDLDPSRRAGLLTLASLMAANAGPRHPSPVKRGVLVLERLLCTELDPPGDVPPLEASVAGAEPRTNREKYEIHVQSPACAGCHAQIDGIGMTFEHYDSLGRWRDTDNGFEVDASGELLGTDRDQVVADAVELSEALSRSRTIHDCYVRQWVRYAFGTDDTELDRSFVAALQEGFWNSNGDILELVVNIAASSAFRQRRTDP